MQYQDNVRCQVKELKWKYGVSYKEMAEWLNMNYNSFMNFVSGYKALGYSRCIRLENIIKDRRRKNA